jgi:hypothetical protein
MAAFGIGGSGMSLYPSNSRKYVSTSDRVGNEFSRITIDPNTVQLNPNRAPLPYSATLYTRLETVGACTSAVFRYSEITSNSRVRMIRIAERRPFPHGF